MLHTAWLEGKHDLNAMDIDTSWAVYSTHHTTLGSSPGAAVFG